MTNRRDLLKSGAALAALAALPRTALAGPAFAPSPGAWRSFDVVTRIEIAKPGGRTQAWIPLPSVSEAAWCRPDGNRWTTNAETAAIVGDPVYGAQMVHAVWRDNEPAPVIEVTSRFATRDRAADLGAPGTAPALTAAERTLYLAPTELIPTGGIVAETSGRITAGAEGQVAKVRAIYEWVVENTYRNAATRGCGLGDIATMLESGNLGGKCADLNALFVGLARAAGIPARDVYGLRVAPSRFGYKSLGAKNEVVTKAQHCRAEAYLDGLGWVAMDPADVRKVILEEPPGNLGLDDPKVVEARQTLFGAWEGNWLAYNTAHDVSLPGADGPRLGFLMYPQAETAGARLDCLDPDGCKYTITATEVVA
jgi:transglutaminase-like putative cysteine protease